MWLLNTEDSVTEVQEFAYGADLTLPMLYDARQPYDRYYALGEGGDHWAPYPLQVVVGPDGIIRSISHQYDAVALDATIAAALSGD